MTKRKDTLSAERLSKSLLFRILSSKAAGMVGKPLLIFKLAQEALDKSGKDSSFAGVAAYAVESVEQLIRLITAYARGEYRDVSTGNIVKVIATILYFVSPLDIIPDFIPVIGYLDDITLIGWVIKAISEELDKFVDWEARQAPPSGKYASMSYSDLYHRARELNLSGRSSMTRRQLAEAIADSEDAA